MSLQVSESRSNFYGFFLFFLKQRFRFLFLPYPFSDMITDGKTIAQVNELRDTPSMSGPFLEANRPPGTNVTSILSPPLFERASTPSPLLCSLSSSPKKDFLKLFNPTQHSQVSPVPLPTGSTSPSVVLSPSVPPPPPPHPSLPRPVFC